MSEPLTREELQERLSHSPFISFQGLIVQEADPEKQRVVMTAPMRPEWERIAGSGQWHGGPIAAVIDTARAFNRRILIVFQPHRYSRTAALMDAFGTSLAGADYVVLTDIYAAGEAPIPGVTLEALAASVRRAVRAPVDVVPALDDVVPAVMKVARQGDLIVTLGAGSVGTLPERLLIALEGRA